MEPGAEAAVHEQPVDPEALGLLLPPGLLTEGIDAEDSTDEGQAPPGLPLRSPGGSELATSSQGSLLHGTGQCSPCAWFWKGVGCHHGQLCEHCHLCPAGELRQRKKMKLTLTRLGLATPKATLDLDAATYAIGSGADALARLGLATPTAMLDLEAATYASSSAANVLTRLGLATPMATLDLDAATYGGGFGFHLDAFTPTAAATRAPLRSPGSLDEAVSTTCGGSENSEEAELQANAALPSRAEPPMLSPNFLVPPMMPSWPSIAPVSWGSLQHGTGTCRPCAWFWRAGGCENSATCIYCHLCPEGELKVRKKSKQAMIRMGLITPKSAASPSESDTKYALSLSACL